MKTDDELIADAIAIGVERDRLRNQRDRLMAALAISIVEHCPTDKLFCGICTPARALLAEIEKEKS